MPLDVLEESSIAKAAEFLQQNRVRRIHWLFNCAGVLHDETALAPEKKLEDIRPEALEHVFRVNAVGPMLVAKHFLPLLSHSERAIVANLSSLPATSAELT